MSQPREYASVDIDIELRHGEVRATLTGYVRPVESRIRYECVTWDVPVDTVLTEYKKRCEGARRVYPEMSPEQAEKVALLAWVKDMEAVSHE